MNYYDNNENKIRRRKVSSKDSIAKNIDNDRIYEKDSRVNNINRNKSRTRNIKNKKKKSKNRSRKFTKGIMIALLIPLVIISSISSIFVISALTGSHPVTKEILESHYVSSEVVSSNDIPKYLKDAIVSIEDERFYEHNGVDIISLFRSLVHNILTDTTQGGSTIDMQVSKNLLTDDDKTIKRKLRDIYNALSMDKNMTKDEILSAYLNNIYLGRGSYGVGKGAKVYFGKDISDLNLAQCAMLAGITNNPARYVNHNEAKKRQEVILYKMNELGYITDEEYKEALRTKVPFASEIG